jgi:hypothetical protein
VFDSVSVALSESVLLVVDALSVVVAYAEFVPSASGVNGSCCA